VAVVPNRDRDSKGLAIPLVVPHASRTFSTVSVDYLTELQSASGEDRLRPQRPTSSVPCLSFCWEIVVPEPWAVIDIAPGVVATGPEPARAPWSNSWYGSWRALTRLFNRPAPLSADASLLRALDTRVVATRPDEVTLGEWFTRWDSGPGPL